MNIGFYNFYTVYNQNRMFCSPESPLGHKLAAPAMRVAEILAHHGHCVSTIDTEPLTSYDSVVFLDYPTRFNLLFRQLLRLPRIPLYLMLNENPSIRPDNYWRRHHRVFRKVFTWHDDLVGGDKYVKFLPPVALECEPREEQQTRSRFCVIISSNKFSNHTAELCSARRRTLDWFAQNQPQYMDLYGAGWDRWFVPPFGFLFNAVLNRAYQRCSGLPRCVTYPFWKGTIPNKRLVLRSSKFSICYENAVFPGYITEKIFDCFFAGCVPVYLGAPNITRYIPANAFIDRRQFPSEVELFHYLRDMPQTEYLAYRAAMDDFLRSPEIQRFGSEAFAKLILEHVVGASPTEEMNI